MVDKFQLEGILKLTDVQIDPRVFRKISQAVAGMPISLRNVNVQLGRAVTHSRTLNKTLNKTASQLTKNEKAARLFLRRMAQFAILLPTFATLNRAIQGSVSFLFEFDSALRDIIRVDVKNLSDRIEEIGDAALKTAVDFGTTATEVLATTRVFKQAGDTIEDSQERARIAILATQISTLSAAQATEVFIAASRQFGEVGKDSAAVLDKLAKVEDIAAVNAADVAEAFRTGGNALAEFSDSIDDSIGLIAALREQTRKSGREIGTFFKTLQTRIFAAGEPRSALEALGIQVENVDGTFRPTLEVLNDLKTRFDQLGDAQAANAAKAIAGVRQFESLIATLNSLDAANRFSIESANAAGTAEEKRLITDAKLERQLGRLIAKGQQLAESLGDAGLEDALTKVLKIAEGILSAFQFLAKTIDGIGGNLAPILAISGFALGRNVLGFGGVGQNKGPKPAKPGDAGFVGPLTKAQSQLASFGTQVGRVGSVFKNVTQLGANLAKQTLTNTQISAANGVQLNLSNNTIRAHTNAIRRNIAAIKTSEAVNLEQRGNPLGGVGATVLLSLLGATAIPAAFNFLADQARSTGGTLGDLGGDFLDAAGNGASLAAQFAVLGPKVAGIAGVFGFAAVSVSNAIDAIDDEIKSRRELASLRAKEGEVGRAQLLLTGDTSKALGIQEALLDALSAGVTGTTIGEDLAAGINEGFKNFIGTDEAFSSGLKDIETVRRALLSNIDIFGEFFKKNQKLIEITAESNNQLDAFVELQDLVASGSNRNLGPAFNRLLIVLGALSPEVNEFTGNIEKVSNSFEAFQKITKVQALADNIRTLGLQLDLAKMGPDALSDSITKLTNELMLAEREANNTSGRLEEELANLFSNLESFAVGLNPAGLSVSEFFTKVQEGVRTLDPEKIEEFENFIEKLPESQRKASEEILDIIEKQFETEIGLQKKRNDLQAEINRRQNELLQTEAKAAQNAFESTKRFTAELSRFGDSVSSEVLTALQSISLSDVNDVLSDKSGLSDNLQELIFNAFADPVTKAQVELSSATKITQTELAILSSRLEDINNKINDQSNASQLAALTAEKHALELKIEETAQKGAIDAAALKIKLLEEEKEAENEAAEATQKRLDLIEKLFDASRAFSDELKKIESSFQEFSNQKIEDLLSKESDARSKLQEAQQDVLSSTEDLSNAYDSLIKAQLDFNGVVTEAIIKSNLLGRDIGVLTGEIFTFDQSLSSINSSFAEGLNQANITLQKRLDLEKQLADQTLSFLQQATNEITQAGLGIFGQTSTENQVLSQGIAGLQFVADQLGGTFSNFLTFTQTELSNVAETLLNLPAEFRNQILDALSFLPSTTNIGGFSVDQLTQAIGQVGAGVAPEVGLPSIEELNNQQVEQLQKLQELALQDAQLQFSQVISAQEQLAAAEEALEATKVLEEKAILDLANEERRELLNAVIEAEDKNTLLQIEKEAQLFAEQNQTFKEVGDIIVQGISSAIGGKLAALEAAANVAGAAKGFIPNFGAGNLTPSEAAGLLRAGAREKKAMPLGAGLAVANTSEAIIPMRHRGFIPNFQQGTSPIAAGISSIKGINETVVAAISQSVTRALSDLGGAENNNTEEVLSEILNQLSLLNDTTDSINVSNATVASNTSSTGSTVVSSPATSERIEISLQTNQNNTVSITGLENLRTELQNAIGETTAQQVDSQITALMEQLDGIIVSLQERGLISAFGQAK